MFPRIVLQIFFRISPSNSKKESHEIQIYPEDGFLRDEIRFRISCLIPKPEVRISKSKSGFPNQKHPKC